MRLISAGSLVRAQSGPVFARIGEESDLVPVRLRPQIEDLNSSRARGPVLKPQIINEYA